MDKNDEKKKVNDAKDETKEEKKDEQKTEEKLPPELTQPTDKAELLHYPSAPPPERKTVEIKHIDENLAPGVEFTTIQYNVVVKFRSALPCAWKMFTSDIMKIPTWEYTIKIGDFTDEKTYLSAILDLQMAMLKFYEGIARDIPKELEPRFKEAKVTAISAAGFDVYSAFDKLPPGREARIVGLLRGLINDDVRGTINQENVVYFAENKEVRLQSQLQAIELRRLNEITIQDMWDFFRNLDDEYSYLAPISRKLVPEYDKVLSVGPFLCWNYFLDRNIIMRENFKLMIKKFVEKTMVVPTKNETVNYRDLLDMLRIRVGAFNRINRLPSNVSSDKASHFIRTLLITSLCSRWVKMNVNFDLDTPDLGQMINALLAKLYCSERVLTVEARYDINNYIARYILPALPGYRAGAAPPFSAFDAKSRTVDFLHLNLNVHRALQGATAPALSHFLIGAGPGTGFSNDDGIFRERLYNPQRFMNRDTWWVSVANQQLMTPSDPVTRFQSFNEFCSIVSRGNLTFGGADRDFREPFQRILGHLSNHDEVYSSYCFYMDRCQRAIGLLSIVHPEDLNEPDSDRAIIDVDANSFLSAFLLVDSEKMKIEGMNLDLLKSGWAYHEWINEFAEKYDFVRQHFPRKYYSKKERLQKTFQMMEVDVGLNAWLNGVIGIVKYSEVIHVPPVTMTRRTFSEKMRLVSEFEREMRGLTGFSTSLVFDRHPRVISDPFVTRRYSPHLDNPLVYSRRQLEMAIQERTTDAIKRAYNDGTPVLFEVPVKVGYTRTDKEIVQSNPLDLSLKSDMLRVMPITYYDTPKDEEVWIDSNNLVFENEPMWHPLSPPVVYEDETFMNGLVHNAVAFKQGFDLYDEFKFVSRSS